MAMENNSSSHNKFQCITTHIVFTFFLFTTFISGIPGVTISPPEAEAAGEITYVTDYSYDDNGNVRSRTTPNEFCQLSV